MDYLTTCLETAGQLGAGILAGPLYTGGGKRHWLSPDEKKREWMLAVDGLGNWPAVRNITAWYSLLSR